MSNLSNLMISGSYLGLINLQDSTQNLASQSGDVDLQDGLGENIGLKINAQTKEFTVVNNFKVDGNADFNGNVDISGSLTHTGSLDVLGDITASGNIKATIGNFDTVNARLLNITEESASVIFSSGSNVLGDDENDRQDLIGQVIVSGTLGVEGNSALTGSLTVTGSTIISGSLTNKQVVSSEAFKVIAANGQEIVDILGGNPANKVITLQDSIFLYKSGSSPRMTLQEEGASPKSSTWFPNIIQFPSGSYGNVAQIKTQTNAGNREFVFGDSTNVSNDTGVTLEDGRAGIYFGESFGFNADFIIGKDKSNSRTIIGGPGVSYMSSSVDIQNNLTVHGNIEADNDISSSTLNGIGNVTIFSASVDSRLDALESDTGSQDSRLDSLEAFTGSQETLNGFYNSFTASNGNDSLNTFTSSYLADSASFDLRLDQQEAFSSSLSADFINTTEFNSYTQSVDNRFDEFSSFTGSYATTGSNTFDGSQEITGSVNGNVETLTISSETASIDCSVGNFFIISGSGNVHLTSTNIEPGQTITVRVESSPSLVLTTDDQTIKFPLNLEYSNSVSSSYDLLSFVSFDNQSLFGVAVNTYNI